MRKPKRKRNRFNHIVADIGKEIRACKTEVAKLDSLITLIEEWTRYEIAARLLPLQTKLCIDYYRRMLEKENEIRELLYGESDLPKLARLLGMDKTERDVRVRRAGDTHVHRTRELKRNLPKRTRKRLSIEPIEGNIADILREAGVV